MRDIFSISTDRLSYVGSIIVEMQQFLQGGCTCWCLLHILETFRHLIKLGECNPECRSPANVLAAVLTPSVYSMQSWPQLSPGQPFCCIADVYSLAPGVGVSQGIALQAGVALNEEFFK